MTRNVVQQVVQRATSDAAFRRQLREDPQTALRGFDLTPDERSALTTADSGRLSALGVDQRMSKVYAAGALEATRSAVGDLGPSAASAAVIPPTHLQMVENDINALSTASSESDALIAGGPTHLQMVEGTLATGAIDADAASAPTHLQMVEGALDVSGSSAINDSQADDRLYFAGGSEAGPVLEGGAVDTSGSTTADPSVNWGDATPTDQ